MKTWKIVVLLLVVTTGAALAQRPAGRRGVGPMPGDVAPDFTLNTKDGKQQITMSELGGRPTALVFASYT